jgi:hypothetical protein
VRRPLRQGSPASDRHNPCNAGQGGARAGIRLDRAAIGAIGTRGCSAAAAPRWANRTAELARAGWDEVRNWAGYRRPTSGTISQSSVKSRKAGGGIRVSFGRLVAPEARVVCGRRAVVARCGGDDGEGAG